jgi:dolichol-phosphate mannosyltransferase
MPEHPRFARERAVTPELSVVVPVYNAEPCLLALHQRLTQVLGRLTAAYEIVLVDDASGDGSWALLAQLAKQDPQVRAFRLSRNFGQHAAITAGLAQSSGSWVVVMDCDLQDPPEDIPRLHAKALEGYDIVLARRIERQHSGLRRLAARVYFRLLGVFNRTKFDHAYGSFSIISRPVVEAFLSISDRARHYLLLLYWLGFRVGTVDYEHGKRLVGHSSYSARALLRHALDGMFFQTTVLLRWIVYLGFALAGAGVLLAAFLIYSWFVRSAYPGWTSLAVLILLVGGFVTVSLGVVALYIGSIFEEVRRRPLYIVSRRAVGGVEE